MESRVSEFSIFKAPVVSQCDGGSTTYVHVAVLDTRGAPYVLQISI